MPGKELPPVIIITDDGDDYDRYLRERGLVPHDGARARGIRYEDGRIEVVIHEDFYLAGGITVQQLPAIAVHEQIEQSHDGPDAHLLATLGEYQFILNQGGQEALRGYHSNLCNLMGGDNSVRNQALEMVLGK